MGLPCSTVAPIPGARLIDPAGYKPSVEVNIPGLGRELVNLVCGTVFNTLTLKSCTNALRTFTYNLIAKEDYKGENFIDLCEFAGGYAVLAYLKDKANANASDDTRLANITAAITTKVPDAITLWMSNLLVKYKDLEYAIGSSVAHKAKQLYETYINCKKEITNMNLDPGTLAALSQLLASQGQNNAMNVAMNQLANNSDPLVNLQINGQNIRMPQSQALAIKAMMAQNQGGMGFGNQNNPVLQALGLGGVQNNQGMNMQQMLAAMQGMNQERPMLAGVSSDGGHGGIHHNQHRSSIMDKWKRDRGIPVDDVEITRTEPAVQSNAVVQEQVTNTSPKESAAISNTLPIGIKHGPKATEDEIPLGNVTFLNYRDSQERVRDTESFIRSAVAKAISANPVYAASAKDDEPVIIMGDKIFSDSTGGIVTQSLETACSNDTDELLITHGYVVKPVYTKFEGVSNWIKYTFNNCSSISSVWEVLNKLSKEPMMTPNSDEQSEDDVQKLMHLISSINAWFTNRINLCLAVNFNSSIVIDSFCEDYEDLKELIKQKYGMDAYSNFTGYMHRVYDSFKENYSETIRKYVKDTLSYPSDKISTIVEKTIVGCLPISSAQMGLLDSNTLRSVDKTKDVTMHRLISCVQECAYKLNFTALNVFIVTNDSVVYSIHESALEDSYIIRRVSDI